MRVALVASLVSPIRPAEANGPHAVILDLARGLAARGHTVTVHAAAGSVAPGVALRQVPVEPAARAAALRAGEQAPAGALAALERGFARLFEGLRRDAPDAVSQHAFDAAAIELAEGLPVLHTLHLAPTDDVAAAARASRASFATVSKAAARMWRRAGLPDVTVLRNGVPTGADPTGPVLPIALVAGRIAPEKGTDVAIRVARRAGLDVRVVGDVYDAAYHAACVEPLLRPGEWLGPLPRRGLSELMTRSAVLVLPARGEEAFGLVAAEAQMAGCPVVAWRRGALPEVVPAGVGGFLVEPDDEAGLAAAVGRSLRLDRRAIRARARRELGVEPMVDAYERALAGLARDSAGSRLAS